MRAIQTIPNFLSHYYEAAEGPFRNLSDLPEAEAEAVLARIRLAGDRFASRRKDDYLVVRRQLELRVEVVSHGDRDTVLKGEGVIDDQVMVRGRITLTRSNLREKDPELHTTDTAIVEGLRELYATLRKGSVAAKAMTRIAAPVAAEAPAS